MPTLKWPVYLLLVLFPNHKNGDHSVYEIVTIETTPYTKMVKALLGLCVNSTLVPTSAIVLQLSPLQLLSTFDAVKLYSDECGFQMF